MKVKMKETKTKGERKMKLHFIENTEIESERNCFIARHVEGLYEGEKALVIDQLYSRWPGEGKMTKILSRYLRRLPEAIAEVHTVAHPYRCTDGLHWKEVIRYARWLRRMGFEFADRDAFFARLKEIRREWGDDYIAYRDLEDVGAMVLNRN